MRPRIDLRFRPSLLLFLGETGARICEQLQSIVHFTSFDPILCQSVALLLVDDTSLRATRIDLSEASSPKKTQLEEDDLSISIDRALKDVQDNRRIQHIIEAGYPIPNTRTQIFIVGDAHSPALAKILDVVYNRLSKHGFATLVCYIINAFRQRQITGVLTDPSSSEEIEEEGDVHPLFATERNLPGFCYLYEDMLNYPTPSFVSEKESHYATAEAIFALIATGITTEPFFEKHMQIGTPFGRFENVGSLSTSLISFPRANILKFCSARLGIILMEQWHQDMRNQHTSVSELDKLQNSARRWAQNLRHWIKDSEPRPWANSIKKHTSQGQEADTEEELLWPTLDILQKTTPPLKNEVVTDADSLADLQRLYLNQRSIHRSLQEETQKLFSLFWPEDIDEEYRRQRRHSANWTRLILQRGNRAVEVWNDWDKRATRAWNSVAERINTEIKVIIDYLWSKDQNGFAVAKIYVDELDDQIASLYNDLSHWRAEHEEGYRQFLSSFESMAESGAWVTPNDTSILPNGQTANGPAQAHPTMQGQHVQGNQDSNIPVDTTSADSTANILGVNPTPVRISSQHLPEREEQVVQNLEKRIIWYQDRIPSVATQIVTAIPFVMALVLAALAWIPHTILFIAIITAIAIILVGFMHAMFRLMYVQQVEKCKEDLLIFYRRYYAYRCERREDMQRRATLGPLRRKIQAIRERLDNLQEFARQACYVLEEEAQSMQEELFNSPAGLRDIFVANGERLQREKKNTLADFAGQMSKLRVKEPLEEWHRSAANLKQQLIQRFRQQSESLMEMTDEETLEQIRVFATSVTSAYLKGPHVELQNALDKPDIWMEALERVENPLYQAQVGIKDPQFVFICGRDFDIGRGLPYIPTHAHPVRVSDKHEWVLLAAFFRGGLPTTINPEILFPEKASLAGPSIEADEINNKDDVSQHSTVNSDAGGFPW